MHNSFRTRQISQTKKLTLFNYEKLFLIAFLMLNNLSWSQIRISLNGSAANINYKIPKINVNTFENECKGTNTIVSLEIEKKITFKNSFLIPIGHSVTGVNFLDSARNSYRSNSADFENNFLLDPTLDTNQVYREINSKEFTSGIRFKHYLSKKFFILASVLARFKYEEMIYSYDKNEVYYTFNSDNKLIRVNDLIKTKSDILPKMNIDASLSISYKHLVFGEIHVDFGLSNLIGINNKNSLLGKNLQLFKTNLIPTVRMGLRKPIFTLRRKIK